MSRDWIEQYSAALTERDAHTRLAHRTPAHQGNSGETPRSPTSSDFLTRLRTDLAATQKARTSLQSQVDQLTATLDTLHAQHKTATARISLLSRQKTDVERKLRDRDDELTGKARLVTEAQDEMVALGLQLNVAEQRTERLREENEELVARWMKRMAEEADKMNTESKWE